MEWISVKDRLPEMGQEILVFKKCDEILSFYAIFRYQGIINKAITHWQPLPKAPK